MSCRSPKMLMLWWGRRKNNAFLLAHVLSKAKEAVSHVWEVHWESLSQGSKEWIAGWRDSSSHVTPPPTPHSQGNPYHTGCSPSGVSMSSPSQAAAPQGWGWAAHHHTGCSPSGGGKTSPSQAAAPRGEDDQPPQGWGGSAEGQQYRGAPAWCSRSGGRSRGSTPAAHPRGHTPGTGNPRGGRGAAPWTRSLSPRTRPQSGWRCPCGTAAGSPGLGNHHPPAGTFTGSDRTPLGLLSPLEGHTGDQTHKVFHSRECAL